MSERRYAILLSWLAEEQLDELDNRTYERVAEVFDLLEGQPFLGGEYNPPDGAPDPPRPCRRIYVSRTTKELFYDVDEATATVRIFSLADARSDPRRKLVGRGVW